MRWSRSTTRIVRHSLAAAISICAMTGAFALVGAIPQLGSSVVEPRSLPWPWLVIGTPLLFSLPLALLFEWFESWLHIPLWCFPLLLILPVATAWAFARGMDGEFEGGESVLKSLPVGVFAATAFTTYWLPLRLVRWKLRRMLKSGGTP